MRKLLGLIVALTMASWVTGEELTLDNVTSPAPNSADEPIAESFSLERAIRFLDEVALDWTKRRGCFSCHTNYIYLLARPAVSADAVAHRQIRSALEELVEKRSIEKGPRWDAEVVMSGALLALNDRATTGTLHPTTRKALDRMWTVQRDDGGFNWLKCGWPPMESDDEYGVAMALVGTYAAPDSYAETEPARIGIQKLRKYLQKNPPITLHQTAMLLWADSYGAHCFSEEQKKEAITKLLSLQKPDGGWASATFGDWKRSDGQPQDTQTSDGYATGFVVYVLRRAGLSVEHPQIQKGVAWLKANQRASGRWFTRSLNKDNYHFLSHAGSAFAVLALVSCND